MTCMIVQNYDELSRVPAGPNLQVLVASVGYVYRFCKDHGNHWEYVGRSA